MERVNELDSITKDRDAKRKLLEDLKRKRLDNFMEGFGIITSKLKEMYQMITLGGDAELELVKLLCKLRSYCALQTEAKYFIVLCTGHVLQVFKFYTNQSRHFDFHK